MSGLLRLFILILVFTIDIHVKADLLMEPKGCWRTEDACVVQARSARMALSTNAISLGLAKNSVLLRETGEHVRLLMGSLSARLNESGQVDVLYGSVSGEAEVLVERDSAKAMVYTLSGIAKVNVTGGKKQLVVPEGYVLRLAAVTSDGQSYVEVPQAFAPATVLKKWRTTSPLSKSQFMREAKGRLGSWKAAIEQASHLQKELAERYIASVEQERRDRAEQLRRQEEENRKLRAMFRKLNYLDEAN